MNYTIKLKGVENIYQFRKKVQTPQDKGNARLDIDVEFENEKRRKRLRDVFEEMQQKEYDVIHAYTFRMSFPYEYFRIKIDKAAKLCVDYEEKFGLRPRFHMVNFGIDIEIKFRILTFHSSALMEYQPELAQKLYQIILAQEKY